MATKQMVKEAIMSVEKTLTEIQTQLEHTATKEDVANAENRLLRWMLGSMGVWSLIIIGALAGNG